jgi:hypothetical protein
MGGYGGLLGIIGQQGKNPLFLVKKFKIETAILFLSFFWSKISGFWSSFVRAPGKVPIYYGPHIASSPIKQQV